MCGSGLEARSAGPVRGVCGGKTIQLPNHKCVMQACIAGNGTQVRFQQAWLRAPFAHAKPGLVGWIGNQTKECCIA